MSTTLTAELHVEAFDSWHTVFQRNRPLRTSHHASNERVYRAPDDDTKVCVVMDFTNPEAADRFIHSDDLRKALRESGVLGAPRFHLAPPAVTKTT